MDMIDEIKAAAVEVYKGLGAGHTELAYEEALEVEFLLRGFCNIRRQVPSPIYYKEHLVGVGYIDIILNDLYIIELKTVQAVSIRDEAQLRKYLTTPEHIGLLINFNPSREMSEVIRVCKDW
jgi:GxxExxY protein